MCALRRCAATAEYNARLCQTYFRPWTLHKKWGSPEVVHASALRIANSSWDESLRAWLLRLSCSETRQHVGNFLAVHRVRPSDEAAANSDDENADTVLKLNDASLRKALERPAPEDPPHAKKQGEAQEDLTQAALSQANAIWASALPAAEQDANPYERCSAKALLQAAR